MLGHHGGTCFTLLIQYQEVNEAWARILYAGKLVNNIKKTFRFASGILILCLVFSSYTCLQVRGDDMLTDEERMELIEKYGDVPFYEDWSEEISD